MANTQVQAARLRSSVDTLWRMLRDVLQVRADVTTMGGATFLAPALDPAGEPPVDPVPDLSAAQMVSAMTALAAVNNALGLDSELHRKSLMALFFTPDVAVERSRAAARGFREAMTVLRQLQSDLLDASGAALITDAAFLTFLTTELGATAAAQIVAALNAVASIDTTLNTGAGTRRKDLNRLAD